MKRIIINTGVLFLLGISFISSLEAAPDTILTIDPSATSGTTITASDENNRNNDISTAYNSHSHTDISQVGNTLNVGDGASGNKNVCANAADTTDRCIRWDDTNNVFTVDQVTASNFNTILTSSGTSALTANALLISGGLGLVDDAMTLAGTQPATYGDVSARVNNSSAIAVTSGTSTILTFDSERWDTDTIHSTASNTGRLTATTAGKYQVTGHTEFASGAGDGMRRLEILLNGATVIASQDCTFNGNDSGQTVRCSITTHYNLAATDYVELRATQRVNATLNVNASGNYSPEFEMVKVP